MDNNILKLSINIDLNYLDIEDFLRVKNLFDSNMFETDNKLKFKDINKIFNLSNRRYQTTSIEYPEQKTYDPHRIQTRTTKIEITG